MAATNSSLAHVGFTTNLSPAPEAGIRRPLDTALVAGTHHLPTDRRFGVPFIPPSRYIQLGAACVAVLSRDPADVDAGNAVFIILKGDRPLIGGIMSRAMRSVGYVAGWGLADGMDAAFGWDGD
jgi:hypothetical protein